MCAHVCVCMFTHTYIPYLCPVRGLGSSDIPTAMCVPNTQILTSVYHCLLKETRGKKRERERERDNTDFRAGAKKSTR